MPEPKLPRGALKLAAEALEDAGFICDAWAAAGIALAARAEAEAALAPDAAKNALQPGGDWLAAAYRTYCDNYKYSEPLPLGRWIQGFEGVSRG